MTSIDRNFPSFLKRIVHFPETDTTYELLDTLAEYRICHDGTPAEARVVFNARRAGEREASYIIKVKIQVPLDDNSKPEQGPSTTAAAEIDALTRFRVADIQCAPHLVVWKRDVQDDDGPLPGGFLTYTVMTKLTGDTLLNLQYWSLPQDERDEIVEKFFLGLSSIQALGIDPYDRALRNILWDPQTRTVSLIDFELWQEFSPKFFNKTETLYKWGLIDMPIKDWYTAWRINQR